MPINIANSPIWIIDGVYKAISIGNHVCFKYSFVLDCRGVILSYCTFWNFSPLVAFYNDPLPILAKCGHYHYQPNLTVIFIPLLISQRSIKHFTSLVRWNTVYRSIEFSLNTIWWDHQLFYFHQGSCNFPGRFFYYHPSTLWKSRKISTPLLIPPPCN